MEKSADACLGKHEDTEKLPCEERCVYDQNVQTVTADYSVRLSNLDSSKYAAVPSLRSRLEVVLGQVFSVRAGAAANDLKVLADPATGAVDFRLVVAEISALRRIQAAFDDPLAVQDAMKAAFSKQADLSAAAVGAGVQITVSKPLTVRIPQAASRAEMDSDPARLLDDWASHGASDLKTKFEAPMIHTSPVDDLPTWEEVAVEARASSEEAAEAAQQRKLIGEAQDSVCRSGISWTDWPRVFAAGGPAADEATTRIAFSLLDKDGNGCLSQEEFGASYSLSTHTAPSPSVETPVPIVQAAPMQPAMRLGPARPSLAELQGGSWPDERLLGQQAATLLVQMWTNVFIFLVTGLLLGFPLTRYLVNSAFDEMEENFREQLADCKNIMADAGIIHKMQQKADILRNRKEDLRVELENQGKCCVM